MPSLHGFTRRQHVYFLQVLSYQSKNNVDLDVATDVNYGIAYSFFKWGFSLISIEIRAIPSLHGFSQEGGMSISYSKISWSGAPHNHVMRTTMRLVFSHHRHCWINNECSYATKYKIILLLHSSSCRSSHVTFANEVLLSLHFDVKCIQARCLMDQDRA